MQNLEDKELLEEVRKRFEEKDALIAEMGEMTKTLLSLNKKAEEADSVKTKFLSLIKNELNNPLSSLLSLSRKLGQKPESGQFEEILEMLSSELYLMDFQLNNIFAASDIEAGQSESFYTRVDMEALLDEAIEKLHYVIKDKSLDVRVKNGCDGPLLTDHKKMQLIVINLLSNACEYSYEEGEVDVGIDCDGTHLLIRVEDKGEGISPEYSENMFEPFVQYTSGAARRMQGLGLGLAVVNALLEGEEGSLAYEPKERGSAFIATVPLGRHKEVNDADENGFFEL